VRVDVKNTSDEDRVGVRVVGDLLGRHAEGERIDIAPGRTASAVLVFPYASEWRPGRHVLPLSIDYTAERQRRSVLAYLALPIAQAAEPALRVTAPLTSLDIRCRLPVRLDSADGQPHRARVRVLTPRGLVAPDPPPLVDVPGQGGARVEIVLLHGTAPPESRQGILIVAESLEGPIERMAVGTSAVDIAPEPTRLANARPPLFVLALILLLAAGVAERHRPRS
jgi:hypothetical protein